MKKEIRIETLVAKYCSGDLSNSELQELTTWIGVGKNKKIFKDYIALNFTIEQLKSEGQDDSLLWEHIEASFKTPVKKINYWKYGVAASIALLIAINFIFDQKSKTAVTNPTIAHDTNKIEIGTDKATLTLENGSLVVLEKGASFKTKNANSNGEKIVYQNAKSNSSSIKYNYLTIPRGGQFSLKLSDGTEVWLNSESQLKYPVRFIEEETREVELVYGEAYFDVSPSTNHKGAKFKVLNNTQEIEVLGTEFNIKAYKDEVNIYTTLVEGKVAINTPNLKQLLTPNQQSILDTQNNTLSVIKVDVLEVISWKEGVFSFINKPLKDIMKVLSRWYDIDIIFENKELESVEFIGTLNKNQSIDEVLSIMKSFSLNNYEIKGDTIILN
tara:strand:+ start:341 stop:1495 length:1155 start_codon:yes stop_codon:yes gene_type:complete